MASNDVKKCIIIGQTKRCQEKKLPKERNVVPIPIMRKNVTEMVEQQFNHTHEQSQGEEEKGEEKGNTSNNNDVKICNIIDSTNRSQTKKFTIERNEIPKTRKKVTDIGEEQFDHTHEEQLALLETKENKLLFTEISRKICGYRQQDIEKNMFNPDKFIHVEHIIDTLKREKLVCHYCHEQMLVLYKSVREPKQWTVDRVDNYQGHNQDNYVVACLKCNLSRRRTNKDKFLFTKQLKIVRL